MQAKYKNLLVLLVSVTLTLFFAELGLRLAGKLYLKRIYTPGVPEPGSTTIVCLGESSTAGMGVEMEEWWPLQLKSMLQSYYPNKRIEAMVPPHVGQNTSQVANRVEDYIRLYDPVLIVIMCGYNNKLCWGESHVVKFIKTDSLRMFKMKSLVWLDRFRLFKLLRYAYIRFFYDRKAPHYDSKMKNLREVLYIWGGPELQVVSERENQEIDDIARIYEEAFIKLWRYDIEIIVSAAKERGIQVLLMTYHINPDYLGVEEFISMADRMKIPLVRNDFTFDALRENGSLNDFLLHDQWHPNRKGYYLIAKNAFEAIRDNRLLER
ncbi:MAG: hypothetical protein AMJ95_08650 [Omnitrophica WOR_2 bacterium SM23_72]|nr:MAG: hypothetical protein AMJ95_08650 [Omnitrophica WOR_2 bacterium SM23_72]